MRPIRESSLRQPLVTTSCRSWDLETAGRGGEVLSPALLNPRSAVIVPCDFQLVGVPSSRRPFSKRAR